MGPKTYQMFLLLHSTGLRSRMGALINRQSKIPVSYSTVVKKIFSRFSQINFKLKMSSINFVPISIKFKTLTTICDSTSQIYIIRAIDLYLLREPLTFQTDDLTIHKSETCNFHSHPLILPEQQNRQTTIEVALPDRRKSNRQVLACTFSRY